MQIQITTTTTPQVKPDENNLGFGKYFSDHMFLASYKEGEGWQDFKIVPRAQLSLDPAASVLHYGQALFEGMKAFRQKNNTIALFRPIFNWARMQEGANRLCMQAPPQEVFLQGIKELVKVDADWVPRTEGTSLYVRPTLIGTEGFLGVRPSREFLFFVILSPVGSYYGASTTDVKIWIEEEYLRAAPGGLGATKAAANYAGSLKAADEARKKGFAQVLWLDVTKTYIEEVGTMNVFFVFKNEIITPPLSGTILGGGIRNSVLQLLREDKRYKVLERKLSLQEVLQRHQTGDLLEVFGTGTAAVISPVSLLGGKTFQIKVPQAQQGPVATSLVQCLRDVQYGSTSKHQDWMVSIES